MPTIAYGYDYSPIFNHIPGSLMEKTSRVSGKVSQFFKSVLLSWPMVPGDVSTYANLKVRKSYLDEGIVAPEHAKL